MKETVPVYAGETSCHNILCWQWKQRHTGKFVLINYSADPAQCRVPFKGISQYQVREELEGKEFTLNPELAAQGVELVLKPYECKIFTFSI